MRGRISNNGEIVDSEDINFGYIRTDYIPVKPNTKYTATVFYSASGAPHPDDVVNYMWLDIFKRKISYGTGKLLGVNSPNTAAYLILSSNYSANYKIEDIDKVYWHMFLMLVEGDSVPSAFAEYVKSEKIPYKYLDVDSKFDEFAEINGVIYDKNYETPDYVIAEAKKVAEKLNELKNINTFSVGWITDCHLYQYSEATSNAFKALDIIGNYADVKMCGVGGDNTSDRSSKQLKKDSMTDFIKALQLNKSVPMWVCKGNHDDGSISTWYATDGKILDAELFTAYDKSQSNDFVVNLKNKDAMYCYKDYPSDGVRIIFLNSVDVIESDGGQHIYAFQNAQLNWFAETLKTTPNGFCVLIMTHICPIQLTSVFGSDYVTYNGNIMFDILKAYKSKSSLKLTRADGKYPFDVSVDFSGCDSDVVGIIVGHTHFDNHSMHDGILIVSTIDASFDNGQTPEFDGVTIYPKVEKTAEETGFDVFTINKDSKKMYVTRYGAGEDREFNY